MSEDPKDRFESVARFSKRDAEALERWDAWLEGIGEVLGRLLTEVPPKVGSKRPARPRRPAPAGLEAEGPRRGLGGRRHAAVRDVDRRPAAGVVRDRRGAGDAGGERGHRHLGRARGARHGLRDAAPLDRRRRHRQRGRVGLPAKAAWARCRTSIRRAAESFGAVVRTDAPVERILTSGGRVTGVALRSGEELSAPIVVAATHPQLTFLRQLDPGVLPDDFVARMRHWRSRSGTVKVNLALSELPDFVADPGTGLQPHHTGAIELAHSLEYLETAFQEARSGQPATRPFSDGCIPSTFDRTHLPRGHPHHEPVHAVGAGRVGRRAAPGGAGGLRRPGDRRLHRAGAEPEALDHPPPGHRSPRDGGHLRADRRQHLPRRAVGRPAVPQPPGGRATPTSARRSRASTRPTRRPTAAAACAASLVGRPPEPCWPTAVRRAGGGRGGRWRDAPAARSCRRRGAAGGAAALRPEPHAAPRRLRRRGGAGVGARSGSSTTVGCAPAASPSWPSRATSGP